MGSNNYRHINRHERMTDSPTTSRIILNIFLIEIFVLQTEQAESTTLHVFWITSLELKDQIIKTGRTFKICPKTNYI